MTDARASDVVSTWYVHDPAGQETHFPSIQEKSGSRSALDIYLRCTCVFFSTARRFHNGRLVLFTNLDGLPEEYARRLDALNVEIVELSNGTRGPAYSGAMWSNQFYIFDILRHVAADEAIHRIIVADSDCVVRRPLDDLFADIKRLGAVPMAISYPLEHKANGISRRELSEICNDLFGEADIPIYYAGGEFLAADRSTAQNLIREFDAIRKRLMEVFLERGGGEEAHALSLLYAHLAIPVGTGNVHVKRCWTSFSYRNTSIEDAENSLAILHLPAEKLTGFRMFYEMLDDISSVSDDTYQKLLRRKFGLPKRSVGKFLRDAWMVGGTKLWRRLVARH